MNFQRLTEPLIVMLSAPFALAGVAAETGVAMLIYLDHAWEALKRDCRETGRVPAAADLYAAIMEGAVERVRPKMMTVVAIMAGLLPILWSTGTGSEVMSRIAAPMVGGMVSSTLLTLAVIPAIYALVKQGELRRPMTEN
jgi:Cu(I)/Ag(I) efflux system membrane protein CusA/SilA